MPPKPKDEHVQINLRIPPDLVALLDELVEKRSAERPGTSISRSDVIREALYQAVRAELPEKPKRGSR